MKTEFIIYQGKYFTLEWYFNENGKSQALEYYDNLEFERQKKAFKLFRSMADAGQIFNTEKFRHEDDQIYAFKPTPNRFLCFFTKGSKIIITNAFEKKSMKLPPQEKEKALRYRNDYLYRMLKGTYYE